VYVSNVTLRNHLFLSFLSCVFTRCVYTRGFLPAVFIHEGLYPLCLYTRVFTRCVYTRGKPTRFAPIPKPAPWRAVTPILGEKISSTANTAAAAMVTVRISSRGRLFRGINTNASATATPSTTYLMMRVKRSFMSILIYICPSDFLLE